MLVFAANLIEMANNKRKIGKRTIALLWLLAVAIVIGTLIVYEQISILYVLASLALIALLLIVGFADLEAVSRTDSDGTQA